MAEPQYIPHLVRQTLDWLKKMDVPVSYIECCDFWEIDYKGYLLNIANESPDDYIGLYGLGVIRDDDLEICEEVYDFADRFILEELPEGYECEYDGKTYCLVSNWWTIPNNRNRLTKKELVKQLDEFIEVLRMVNTELQSAYISLFEPPEEIWEEIVNNAVRHNNNNNSQSK